MIARESFFTLYSMVALHFVQYAFKTCLISISSGSEDFAISFTRCKYFQDDVSLEALKDTTALLLFFAGSVMDSLVLLVVVLLTLVLLSVLDMVDVSNDTY